jgi:hypothetical protein
MRNGAAFGRNQYQADQLCRHLTSGGTAVAQEKFCSKQKKEVWLWYYGL